MTPQLPLLNMQITEEDGVQAGVVIERLTGALATVPPGTSAEAIFIALSTLIGGSMAFMPRAMKKQTLADVTAIIKQIASEPPMGEPFRIIGPLPKPDA